MVSSSLSFAGGNCGCRKVRVAESSLTLTTYFLFTQFLGANLISAPSLGLIPFLLIPVLIGVPAGAWLLGRVSRDAFTRLVMAMDGLVVSFGLSQVMVKLRWVGSTLSALVFGVIAAFIVGLATYSLYRLPGAQKLVDLPPALSRDARGTAPRSPPDVPVAVSSGEPRRPIGDGPLREGTDLNGEAATGQPAPHRPSDSE